MGSLTVRVTTDSITGNTAKHETLEK